MSDTVIFVYYAGLIHFVLANVNVCMVGKISKLNLFAYPKIQPATFLRVIQVLNYAIYVVCLLMQNVT